MDKQRQIAVAQALMEGQAGAFEEFVEHFRAKIFQYSWMMCGQREDAEEVAQETLLHVFENLNQLREPEKVRAWVFRIARNTCLMKRRKSIFAPGQELSLDDMATDARDCARLPDRAAIESQQRHSLNLAIAQLPDTYRAVVLLRDIEELSTEETAQILDISNDAVKTRLHRGRMALRQILVSR